MFQGHGNDPHGWDDVMRLEVKLRAQNLQFWGDLSDYEVKQLKAWVWSPTMSLGINKSHPSFHNAQLTIHKEWC